MYQSGPCGSSIVVNDIFEDERVSSKRYGMEYRHTQMRLQCAYVSLFACAVSAGGDMTRAQKFVSDLSIRACL